MIIIENGVTAYTTEGELRTDIDKVMRQFRVSSDKEASKKNTIDYFNDKIADLQVLSYERLLLKDKIKYRFEEFLQEFGSKTIDETLGENATWRDVYSILHEFIN